MVIENWLPADVRTDARTDTRTDARTNDAKSISVVELRGDNKILNFKLLSAMISLHREAT